MSKNTQLGNLVNGIYVDSTGKVGVGTQSPSVALDVVGAGKFSTTVTAQTGLKLPANGNGTSPTLAYNNSLGFGVSGTGIFFGNLYNSDLSTAMQLRVTNSGGTDITAMTITPTGNVGIGTDSPLNVTTNRTSVTINGTSTSILSFGSGGVGKAYIYNDGTNLETFSAGALIYNTAGSERMRITSGGNVGINTTFAPAANGLGIAIYKNDYPRITFRNSTTGDQASGGFQFYLNGNDFYQESPGNTIFANSGTERMRITSAGRVLMSTQATGGGSGILEVTNSGGASADNGPSITCVKSSATTSSSARFIQFYASGGSQPMGGIVGNGAENAQFATLSDIRDKENIQSIDGSLDKILALNPVQFNWKKSKEHVKAGFIAQQVEEIFPEYVLDNFANEGDEPRKAITGGLSSGIIVHLVKAIQELSAEINILKQK